MPSYRVRMVIGLVHAGVDPADVLPQAVAAGRARTAVESGQVDLVRGLPCVTVRFEAADDLEAARVGRAVVERVDELAVVETSRITRRTGNRWSPMRA
ncbi:hypothetical protein [Cellulomonas carbonis]|uniref:Thiamine-binding protein domain-containing protein n=1 Tax=Cellulomonas carbonis T26 TaxID=947969 RepID=A0A0A0BP76_9CELL|nr:hypothetical protein [Cellulomonas carbonis]KGM08909.1 hypothetical protein N868_12715 [Cellulomonas carbonis T26]MDT0165704.1 hypothetical protein [Actinotalea sp. AC32]